MTATEKLRPGLTILFIGFNPSVSSYQRGYNYAGRSNRFYKILYLAGLTDRLYSPEESVSLPDEYGYGFTNVVSRPTTAAQDISWAEYREGAGILRRKLELNRPRIACYVGKGVYQACIGGRLAVPWGLVAHSIVPGVRDFVAPATSGLVRMRIEEQATIFKELQRALAGD
ncbi:MAG: mismatch-specific DNA-glycosylase [Bacilli bacterium]